MAVLQSEANGGGNVPNNSSSGGNAQQPEIVAPVVIIPPWYKQLWTIKLTFVVILTPIVCIPIPLVFPNAVSKTSLALERLAMRVEGIIIAL